ncbi:MAG: glucans biosynthesis glucosyltransferase MdoH [Pseudomonadota bacterium]
MLPAETFANSVPAAPAHRGAVPDGALERTLFRRRVAVAVLNALTILGLAAVMVFAFDGQWTASRVGMFLAFLITLPWLSIGFWNAIIGVIVMGRAPRSGDPLELSEGPGSGAMPAGRTAITMAIRNENAAACLARLRGMLDELEAQGVADHFDIHVLSDTSDPAIAEQEAAAVNAWRATSSRPLQIFYRRRESNEGYKAGNLQEFCRRTLGDYDYFLPLDADSYMSGAAILRLHRIMEANPKIGILQSLVVGTPSSTFFTRVFQFGMRHGMRAYTAGAAWWTGDCGPYWGHNALIRTRPFAEHCHLPVLPGKGPLSGFVMSHDQVEAVLMRRAGYQVRVLAEEGESWEENPPSLPDFIRRELRWCQGNMQYFQLLTIPRLKLISRVQLVLAILMYLGPPAWMTFIMFGAISIFDSGGIGYNPAAGLFLFCAVMSMTFAPKILGLAGILASARQSRRYGGRLRVLAGGLAEVFVSMLMAPVVAFAVAAFVLGLMFGRKLDWRAQPRGDRSVGWAEAATSFWPQTVFGALLCVFLALTAPGVLPWAAPVIAGLVLAIPFTVVTTSRTLSRWSVGSRVCDIPEDPARPPALDRIGMLLAPA